MLTDELLLKYLQNCPNTADPADQAHDHLSLFEQSIAEWFLYGHKVDT